MRRKSINLLMALFSMALMLLSNSVLVSAKETVNFIEYVDIFGTRLNSITIYDDGEVILDYKYGLKKVDLLYCEKGRNCDNDVYDRKTILESTAANPHKNTSDSLASYSFKIGLEKDIEYLITIEAYFAKDSSYHGDESIGDWVIGTKQTLDSKNTYIKGTGSDTTNIKDEDIKGLLENIQHITNKVILPIIYIATTMVLVIKGALLGVQIVKNADDTNLRQEKVHALKWLVIGVGITYVGASFVGLVTGFFKNAFNL